MALFNGMFKLGLAAGAVYAAMKVADKYKENNPNGVEGTMEKIAAVKEAATQVYGQAADIVKENIPGVSEKVNSGVQRASDFASEKMPGVVEKIQEAVDKFAEKAPEFAEKVQEAVDKVSSKVSEYAEAAAAKSAEEQFEEVVDADFEPVEESAEEKTEE